MNVKRLPRKLKKQLKRQGLNPKIVLEDLRAFHCREKQLKKLFPKESQSITEVLQQEIGGEQECITNAMLD